MRDIKVCAEAVNKTVIEMMRERFTYEEFARRMGDVNLPTNQVRLIEVPKDLLIYL